MPQFPLARVAMVLAGALAAGCVTSYSKAPDPESAAKIDTIAFLDFVGPLQYRVMNAGSANMAFGLIGAMDEIGTENSRAEAFDRVIRARFDAATHLQAKLKAALEARGYTVVVLPGQKATIKDGKGDWSAIETDADALLEVGLMGGYTSDQFSTKYDPTLRAFVRVGAPRTGDLIYFQSFTYGAKVGTPKGVIHIPPVAESRYGTYADLMEDPEGVVEGLRTGVDVLADAIANSLPRREAIEAP